MHQWVVSPGKLNLFLYVTGRRSDGYHYLQTLFRLLDYGDNMKFFVTKNGCIRLFNTNNNIISNNNLVIQAAKLLRKFCFRSCQKKPGVDIILHKKLPIGSGLGGGSSNAATTLMILNQEWRCFLEKKVLMRLGLMLGADIPVFINGYSAFSEGIGEKLVSIFLPERWYLIIIPPIYINTTWVFDVYRSAFNYYSPYRSVEKLLNTPFSNDLEPIVKNMFPEIKKYFFYLSNYASARLTGTGACIFFEFYNRYLACQSQKYLPNWIKSIVVRGIYISPVHQILSKIKI
ncbi:4-diphosphocytidyl-2-C-methyl-D-erythritol kinase [Candidatus Blochmanniella vafra str. BVAF]|uniref:4-diphosphocytidyl-2-C-methyl-D-erythritol kinase n=2 Tax=Candidatus Blochmanniella vafra TaxID=251535 RepID=E8Q6Z6_BLOVB|nr:4-diphosphocytidyl-2-C-methyl-D-erythritol kinase [Candidatus Blochmannia vafer str. BVAF]